MARVLITGASGLLGSNLASDWAEQHEVFGTYHRNRVELSGVEMVQTDFTRPGAAQEIVERCQPDWIINCAAVTDLDRCEQEPEWAGALNHLLAGEIAERAQRAGIRLVHISTDAVFDGRSGGYKETDPPNPLSVYGRTKLAGEQAVLGDNPGALVVRTNLFGWNKQPKRNLVEWFLRHLESGRECPGFTDVHFSPILVNDLGGILLELLPGDAGGVLHIAGRTCLSKYDFGVRLAQAIGANPELIRPISVEQADLVAPRAKNLCIDSSAVEAIIKSPVPEIDAAITRLFERRDEKVLARGEAER